jgi:hypothetical protein
MKKFNPWSALIGFVMGCVASAIFVSLHTGLRIDQVFDIGDTFRKSNKQFLSEYSLSLQNSAVALMILEEQGSDKARELLWHQASPIYRDHLNDKPRSELDRCFGRKFAEFVEQSEPIRTLADKERTGALRTPAESKTQK